MTDQTEEVRRDTDGELMGLLAPRDGSWEALTVFGATLGRTDSRDGAVDLIRRTGLAVLDEPWWLQQDDGSWHECVLQEVAPDAVRLYPSAYGYPDFAAGARTLRGAELRRLRREPPTQ